MVKTKTQSSSLKGKLMKTELGHGAEGILTVKCTKEGHYIDKQDEYLIL